MALWNKELAYVISTVEESCISTGERELLSEPESGKGTSNTKASAAATTTKMFPPQLQHVYTFMDYGALEDITSLSQFLDSGGIRRDTQVFRGRIHSFVDC